MKDFISEIKKIPTDGLIYCLSEKSIDMFIQNHSLKPKGRENILLQVFFLWQCCLEMVFIGLCAIITASKEHKSL